MQKAQAAQIKKQGQRPEPVEHLGGVWVPDGEFIKERLVMGRVLGGMRAHIAIIGAVSV